MGKNADALVMALCSYEAFKTMPADIAARLSELRKQDGSFITGGAWDIYELVGSDAYYGCRAFLQRSLIYEDAEETILSKRCTAEVRYARPGRGIVAWALREHAP